MLSDSSSPAKLTTPAVLEGEDLPASETGIVLSGRKRRLRVYSQQYVVLLLVFVVAFVG